MRGLAEGLRDEIRTGDERTRKHARLHEDLISRIALLQEALAGRRRRKP